MMKINWKYAIGEILIVMIGISLAFTLNNWKEYTSNKNQRKQYLDNVVLDIQQEIKQIESINTAVNAKLLNIQKIKPFLGKPDVRRDSIVRMVFELARMVNFHPVNTTYQTLINSGDMKLIDNFDLRRSLEEHYALHNIVLQNYERISQIHQKYLGDFFIYNIDFTALYQGDISFLDNPLIRNIITSIEGAYRMVLEGNQQCLESNQGLLNKLEIELSQF